MVLVITLFLLHDLLQFSLQQLHKHFSAFGEKAQTMPRFVLDAIKIYL